MADGYNRFNAGGQYYYPNNHNSSHNRGLHHRNGSPINNTRSLFQANNDTPSPNRSPGTHSPAHHNTFNMYNHNNHRQNHALLNGGAGHQTFQPQIGLNKAFQSQSHGGHQSHHNINNSQHAHQDHGTLGGGNHASNNYSNHQHNISASTLSHTTPQFTPAHLQNGTPENSSKAPNEHWAEQLREYGRLRLAEHKTHYYARSTSTASRFPGPSSISASRAEDGEHGDRRRPAVESEDMGTWDAMDLCGQGLKGIAPVLFKHYPKLHKVYLTWNKLRSIPPQIGQMRFLTILDLSMNELTTLPPEIGMLTTLKKLSLYDNHIEDLPYELGSLYQLEMLGMEGNPLRSDYMERLKSDGTQELIRHLREQAPRPDPPMDRAWVPVSDDTPADADTFTVLSWNILCERSGNTNHFGYAPTEAILWPRRRDMILDEITGRNADILCLQEVDGENYNEFFRPNLASHDYKAFYYQKSRALTMSEREAKSVDGCAIFWKNSKYVLLDKAQIQFSREAISRPDMKGEHDVYNRIMPRDHVAIVVFLENRQTGSRLVVANTHLTWEPWYNDVKIVQMAIMMEYLNTLAEKYVSWPACKDKELFKYANEDPTDGTVPVDLPPPAPSLTYDEPTQIPLLICGDFNSMRGSGVHELITQGSLSNSHPELGAHHYGDLTRHGMAHPFSLKSAYGAIGELPFTNYTPGFREAIDWVFYSTSSLSVAGLLGEVDMEFMRLVPGWPYHYFPSDHLALLVQFAVKERKEKRAAVQADFGGGKSAAPGSRKESRS